MEFFRNESRELLPSDSWRAGVVRGNGTLDKCGPQRVLYLFGPNSRRTTHYFSTS